MNMLKKAAANATAFYLCFYAFDYSSVFSVLLGTSILP